ncbi:MAG: response regulator [Gammaproteobacteria bacterium]|nr:response regulator [Gammaproteobacteria bacterium]MDH3507293.1 response regulator [Gammaproteobacteria bacterium]
MLEILVVDDEATVRRIMRVALAKAGYKVSVADNGESALAAIRERAPDVLITDIEMPRMDGRALCAAVKKEFPYRAFPIFVVTSLTAHDHRKWAQEIPNLHFLEKPVSIRQLTARLTESVGTETVIMKVGR